jgi:hypothetical protein
MDIKEIHALEQLKQIVSETDKKKQPFLYFFPLLLTKTNVSTICPSQALRFAEVAIKHDRPVIVTDALTILNRIISPVDGSLLEPSKNTFFDNQSFFWDSLGSRTKATDIILHIFNKTYFEIMVGQHT